MISENITPSQQITRRGSLSLEIKQQFYLKTGANNSCRSMSRETTIKQLFYPVRGTRHASVAQPTCPPAKHLRFLSTKV